MTDAFFQDAITAAPANHSDDLNTPTHSIKEEQRASSYSSN